jgi:hypothetical protein
VPRREQLDTSSVSKFERLVGCFFDGLGAHVTDLDVNLVHNEGPFALLTWSCDGGADQDAF